VDNLAEVNRRFLHRSAGWTLTACAAEWRETVRFWKSCGVTHLTLGTYSGRGHLRRIEGRTLGDHLAAIKRYWNAVADLL
jgi:hypothetical protein